MKKKTSAYVTWMAIAVLLIGGIGLIINGKNRREQELAARYQDVTEDSPSLSVAGNSGGSAATANAQGPYKTEGGNEQENDNYFVKGRINTLVDLAEKDKKTVVWVSAPWCEICHAMRPFIHKSVNKFADKVAIKEIDFDSNPHLVKQMGLYGTPDFIVIDSAGKEIKRWGGATQSSFEAQLQAVSQL